MCLCMYVHVCFVYMYVCVFRDQGLPRSVSLRHSPYYFLYFCTVFHKLRQAGWLARKPQRPLGLLLARAGIMDVHLYAWLFPWVWET